jgi:streptomycin 3"-kinase
MSLPSWTAWLPGDGWEPVSDGESGAGVFRRGRVFAKCCGASGVAELAASFVGAVRAVHALPVASCPFERSLASTVAQAEDVVRRGAVNPDFLPVQWQTVSPEEVLARVRAEQPSVAAHDLVVCHGDACLPNFLFDPDTLALTGVIDVDPLTWG